MEIQNLRFTATDRSTPMYFQTEYTPINGNNLQEAIGDEYLYWKAIHPVFIDAPTGFGKSTFVNNCIIPYAKKKDKNVLIVSNRIALNSQLKNDVINKLFPNPKQEIIETSKDTIPGIDQRSIFDSVGFVTYQKLPSFLSGKTDSETDTQQWLSELGYVIFDEVHFFYSDALFNSMCGSILKKLPLVFRNAVRIYMTATPWEIIGRVAQVECKARMGDSADFLKYAKPYNLKQENSVFYKNTVINITYILKYYSKKCDYTKYNLHFFGDELESPALPLNHPARTHVRSKCLQALIAYMNPLPSPENKWLIFVEQKRVGQHLKQSLSKMTRDDGKRITVSFIESGSKRNSGAWKTLISDSKFNADVLISTSVIENGVNIKDDCIHNIAIFCTERTTFIQELGRKRREKDETVDLWVWVPTEKQLMRKYRDLGWTIRLAKTLLYSASQAEKAEAARQIWDTRSKAQYNSLFHINNKGAFSANQYVLGILESQYHALVPICEKRYTYTFQKMVQSWLNREAMQYIPVYESTGLIDKLRENVGIQFSEEAFQTIRQMIVQEVSNKRIAYIRSDRKNTLSAKTLNQFLDTLNIPFHVKKAKKQWTITAFESSLPEQSQ